MKEKRYDNGEIGKLERRVLELEKLLSKRHSAVSDTDEKTCKHEHGFDVIEGGHCSCIACGEKISTHRALEALNNAQRTILSALRVHNILPE